MITLARMITPPIVGVPAFFKWDCTPSTRSVCPIFNFLKNGITTGPSTRLSTNEINTGITT